MFHFQSCFGEYSPISLSILDFLDIVENWGKCKLNFVTNYNSRIFMKKLQKLLGII
jgi:hypothetical protein